MKSCASAWATVLKPRLGQRRRATGGMEHQILDAQDRHQLRTQRIIKLIRRQPPEQPAQRLPVDTGQDFGPVRRYGERRCGPLGEAPLAVVFDEHPQPPDKRGPDNAT
jgi:hypothetical protein